jgi:hypothetical protein
VNQRNVVEAATLYGIENGIINANLNVTVLQPQNYISTPSCECPSSNTPDFDDYTLTFVNQRVDAISCDVEPAVHAWTGFK